MRQGPRYRASPAAGRLLMTQRKYVHQPTPDVAITIPGKLRFWVAEALLEQIKWATEAERDPRRRPARAIPASRQQTADELRDLYNEIVP
jgi:hypothetical protein